jgi:hypothetical protein
MESPYIPKELLTLRQHAERYPYLSLSALRDRRFCSIPRVRHGQIIAANGLAPAFHELGHCVYVDPEMLRRLIAENQSSASSKKRARSNNG